MDLFHVLSCFLELEFAWLSEPWRHAHYYYRQAYAISASGYPGIISSLEVPMHCSA